MKKRIISLLMVVLLFVSLVPTGALAESRALSGVTVTFTSQPTDVTVRVGDTAIFTATAEADATLSKDMKYLWLDSTDVDPNADLSFMDIVDLIAKSVGKEKTLVLESVTAADNGNKYKCIAYCSALAGLNKGFGYAVSNEVTLTVLAKEPCKEHTLIKTEAKAATCAAEGNIEYYYCSVCQNYYLDSAATQPTTLAACTVAKLTTHGDIQKVEAKTATCAEKGCKEHWYCSVCGKYFSDEAGSAELSVSSVEIPKNASNHTDLQHFDRVEPTCSAKGTIEHWYCSGCDTYFSDAEGKTKVKQSKLDIDKDNTKHASLEYTKASPATCEDKGNIPYYYCADCNKYFSDAEGKAEIKKNDTELNALGHDYKWAALSDNGVEYHAQQCSRCGKLTNTGKHAGGTATCIAKAVCTVCGFEYGAIDAENHVNKEYRIIVAPTPEKDGTCDVYCKDCQQCIERNAPLKYKDACEHEIVKVDEVPAQCETTGISGTKEHYKCTKCGTLFSDAAGASEITDASTLTIEPLKHYIAEIGSGQIPNMKLQTKAYDSIGHWSVCKYCDYRYTGTYNSHTFLPNQTPTCHSGKTCLGCDYDDGTRDMTNHDGGTELRGEKKPSGTEPGYTGDTYCLGCETIITKGHEYYNACPDGCEKTLKFVAGTPKTCTKDGTRDYYVCTVCNNMYLDKNASIPTDSENIVDKCTGHDLHPGMDALTAGNLKDLAKAIGLNYAELIKMITDGNFTLDNFLGLIHIKDIDHCYDDTYHWLGCQRCGKTLENLKDELEAGGVAINSKWYELSKKTAHTGGTATCQKKAVCDECGEEYGSIGDHRYDAVVTPATCTKDGYTTHTCSGCKDSYTDTPTAKTGHKIVRGQCTICKGYFKNPFYDVNSDAYYYKPVLWAYYYQPQITSGISDELFGPTNACTRAQVVTFLWRAAGCPEPTSKSMQFTDVKSSAYYYKAVLWAVENGITNGVGNNQFAPDQTVTRAQFVTFLWRYYDKPSPSNLSGKFSDVGSSAYYYKAVLWAAEKGITQGTGYGNFSPDDPCQRCQVVTFLYRAITGDTPA